MSVGGQIEHSQGDQQVVGQQTDRIEHLVGHQLLAGRMVEIQVAEQMAEPLFTGALERVELEHTFWRAFGGSRRCVIRDDKPITPKHLTRSLASNGRKGVNPVGFFARHVFDPGKTLHGPVRIGRLHGPLGLRQLGRQLLQFVGPLVVADTPTAKAGGIDLLEELDGTGSAVGEEPALLPLPQGRIGG